MPPFPRTARAEFHSLLLPPIRVSLGSLRSLCHRNVAPLACAARPVQYDPPRRYLHLWVASKSKTTLGQHELLSFHRYNVPNPQKSTHKFNLVVSDTNKTLVAEDVSLEELYENHVRPGYMLYATQQIPKKTAQNFQKLQEDNVPDTAREYALLKAHTMKVHISEINHGGTSLGPIKTAIFGLFSPAHYFKAKLESAYQFLERGCPVEFRIRFANKEGTKLRLDAARGENLWYWIHNHFPHLRPDIILKSMPKGTVFVIDPVASPSHLQFVLKPRSRDPNGVDRNKRLSNLRSSVKSAIEQGKYTQVPKKMRKAVEELLETKKKERLENYTGPEGEAAKLERLKFLLGQGQDVPEIRAMKASTENMGVKDLERVEEAWERFQVENLTAQERRVQEFKSGERLTKKAAKKAAKSAKEKERSARREGVKTDAPLTSSMRREGTAEGPMPRIRYTLL